VSRRGPATVLVYHPEGSKAYADAVRLPRGVRLAVCATPAEAMAVADEINVIYGWKFPQELYVRAPRLTWIQVMGAGVDWVLAGPLPPGVVITRVPGVFGPWMREYVVGWCAWVTQRMELYRAAQREQRWIEEVLPDRLLGKTMTVVGLGDIGSTIATAARGLGMRVLGVSRSGRAVRGVERVYRVNALARALAPADFVVLVVPLTDATRGLLDARALAAMKPTAWLLNIGRGALVDEPALLEALRGRRVGGAVLDVFPTEPLPAGHPFWSLDNVVVTPHISGPSTPEQMAPVFNDNLARWRTGRPLRHVVDRSRGY
jgi:glyoxylate/hydroxypyruvate reductase A